MSLELTDNNGEVWAYEKYFCLLPTKLKNGKWTWFKTVALVYEIEINFIMGHVEKSFLIEEHELSFEALRNNREVISVEEISKHET